MIIKISITTHHIYGQLHVTWAWKIVYACLLKEIGSPTELQLKCVTKVAIEEIEIMLTVWCLLYLHLRYTSAVYWNVYNSGQ